jgi:hypothetical protein
MGLQEKMEWLKGCGVSRGSLTWVTLLNEYLAGMSLGRD